MRVRELLLLAEGLLEIQESIDEGFVDSAVFDMSDWRIPESEDLDINHKGFDCGFAGCAIGWAPKFIPDFPFKTSCAKWYEPITFVDIAIYFGIDIATTHRLFGSGSYGNNQHSPKLVAERIYDVVRGHFNEQTTT